MSLTNTVVDYDRTLLIDPRRMRPKKFGRDEHVWPQPQRSEPPAREGVLLEYWKPRTTFRCTTMQVYDLAWSPIGDFLLAGSIDNATRVFAAADGATNIFVIGEASKLWISLPKGKSTKLTISEERDLKRKRTVEQ
ncbi:hypothetical protein C8R44DRAFT_755216 [Mycena epipterygia]|nr:hypothetical protein C8R44DRAFT_755216 [Mycena epipterygia]